VALEHGDFMAVRDQFERRGHADDASTDDGDPHRAALFVVIGI
jgi:hypothetical protein